MIQDRLQALRMRGNITAGRAILIQNPVNVRYLSGFTGGEAQLLITLERNILITDFRYTEQATLETCGLYEIERVQGALYTLVEELLRRMGISVLLLEEDFITYKEYKGIQNTLSWVTLRDAQGLVQKLRQIKEPEELSLMSRAARIGDQAFAHILTYIRPGITEMQVKHELEYQMKQLGASDVSFETIVASGKRSAMPHGTASEKMLEDGDIVTMDFGCIYQGYCSDMTRTFFVGACENRSETPVLKKIYHIVNTARERAILAAKAGMTGKELDAVARSYIAEQGYGSYFGHGLGHSVGLEIHETPNANLRNEDPLPAGAVITIEPGIYLEGIGGVRIEDMIQIRETDCKVLTAASRELRILS